MFCLCGSNVLIRKKAFNAESAEESVEYAEKAVQKIREVRDENLAADQRSRQQLVRFASVDYSRNLEHNFAEIFSTAQQFVSFDHLLHWKHVPDYRMNFSLRNPS
jgi:hypothetical protein